MINPTKAPDFFRLLSELSGAASVDVVIALRRIDDFIESMYLHSTKSGDLKSSIDEYASMRTVWVEKFFEGLSLLRELAAVTRCEYVPYRKERGFLTTVAGALGVPANVRLERGIASWIGGKLALKAQIVMLFLAEVEAEIGEKLHRAKLVRAFEDGTLTLANDIQDYRVMPASWSEYFHKVSLLHSSKQGIAEYNEAFSNEVLSEYSHEELSFVRLQKVDFEQLKAWSATNAIAEGSSVKNSGAESF